MMPALLLAAALAGGAPAGNGPEVQAREAFAAHIRGIVERGDVEAFIALLSPDGLVCNDGIIPTKQVAAELRKKRGFYPLLFDTAALRASGFDSMDPVLSYRDFFAAAKDAVPTVDLDFNIVRWRSEVLGRVASPPYFGVERVGGRLRIGLVGDGCH